MNCRSSTTYPLSRTRNIVVDYVVGFPKAFRYRGDDQAALSDGGDLRFL